MILTIKDGSLQEIFIGSMVTIDPTVFNPSGPFKVIELDDNGQMKLESEALENTIGADILIDVSNIAIEEKIFDFGNGEKCLLFPKAFQLVTDLMNTEKALMQQVIDLQSGDAVRQLLDQVAALQAEMDALKAKIQKCVDVFPKGSGEKMNILETVLFGAGK